MGWKGLKLCPGLVVIDFSEWRGRQEKPNPIEGFVMGWGSRLYCLCPSTRWTARGCQRDRRARQPHCSGCSSVQEGLLRLHPVHAVLGLSVAPCSSIGPVHYPSPWSIISVIWFFSSPLTDQIISFPALWWLIWGHAPQPPAHVVVSLSKSHTRFSMGQYPGDILPSPGGPHGPWGLPCALSPLLWVCACSCPMPFAPASTTPGLLLQKRTVEMLPDLS